MTSYPNPLLIVLFYVILSAAAATICRMWWQIVMTASAVVKSVRYRMWFANMWWQYTSKHAKPYKSPAVWVTAGDQDFLRQTPSSTATTIAYYAPSNLLHWWISRIRRPTLFLELICERWGWRPLESCVRYDKRRKYCRGGGWIGIRQNEAPHIVVVPRWCLCERRSDGHFCCLCPVRERARAQRYVTCFCP